MVKSVVRQTNILYNSVILAFKKVFLFIYFPPKVFIGLRVNYVQTDS